MNEEEIVEIQKKIEKENEANINDTIDCMSLHINGQMTKEYLKFIKKTRNFKKKINKKKIKLAENGILEEAYQKKDGTIEAYFEEVAKDYKNSIQEPNRFRQPVLDFVNFTCMAVETLIRMDNMMAFIDTSSRGGKYMDLIFYKNGPIVAENMEFRKKLTGIEIKAREEIIQKHYDSITAYIMGQVLCYYDSELDFWKDCLKQLEKLDDIREFE